MKTTAISTTTSTLLNNRLLYYLESNDILVDEQNGFRPGRSCIDHIFSLSTLVQNRLNENKSTFAAFIDMEKAFDWIDRDLLFYKLLSYNITGKFYRAVVSLYCNTMSCVRLNQYITPWFNTVSGVRQGDVLSPTLFAVFINDLSTELKRLQVGIPIGDEYISVLLYADDIVLLAENEEALQKMLDALGDWSRNWRLKVNCCKSKIIHFRKKQRPITQCNFTYQNTPIEIVCNYKYLGCILMNF